MASWQSQVCTPRAATQMGFVALELVMGSGWEAVWSVCVGGGSLARGQTECWVSSRRNCCPGMLGGSGFRW